MKKKRQRRVADEDFPRLTKCPEGVQVLDERGRDISEAYFASGDHGFIDMDAVLAKQKEWLREPRPKDFLSAGDKVRYRPQKGVSAPGTAIELHTLMTKVLTVKSAFEIESSEPPRFQDVEIEELPYSFVNDDFKKVK